uniref:Uncharacterized protein n=1 Tax=Panagrellus redivivus TaxID=6233 RepID=A0A7E4UQV6_PANRE
MSVDANAVEATTPRNLSEGGPYSPIQTPLRSPTPSSVTTHKTINTFWLLDCRRMFRNCCSCGSRQERRRRPAGSISRNGGGSERSIGQESAYHESSDCLRDAGPSTAINVSVIEEPSTSNLRWVKIKVGLST